MFQIKTSNERFYLAVACLVAVVAILPIAFFGIPDGYDLPQHFQFAQTYYDSLTNGDGFPSWSDKENFGYGGVGIRFYPPLAYYALAFARMLVGDWYNAAWLTFTFWMVLGCLGVYFWIRWWFSAKEAAIAACFYAIIPYHLSQLYIAFNYAEFAASAILPFCFAFLTRVFQRGKTSDVLGLSISFGLLLITHLPLGLIGSISLFVYALTLLQKKNFLKPVVKSAIGAVIGLAASAFYWVGMVGEMKWLNHASDRYSTGHYGFAQSFFPFYFHALETDNKFSIILSDFAIILNLLFILSAVIYLIYRKNNWEKVEQPKSVFQTVVPLGLFAFFMVTPLSRPIWEIITPLQKVQFPARWLTIVSMCGAVVAAASVHYLLKGNFLKRRVWAYGCLIFLSTVALYNFVYIFHPTSFVPIAREKFENQMQELPEAQSFNAWWSVWSKADALKTTQKIVLETRQTKVISWEAEKRIFEVSAGNDAIARVATFYYPHWQATVNGNSVEVGMDENGAILIPVGSEKSTVELYFQEPLMVRIASILSLITWLFLSMVFVFIFVKKLFFTKQILR